MNKKRALIWGFLSILFINLIYAQTYKIDNSLDLKIPFEVNGSIPSSTATCNISIQYPNGTYVRDNNVTTNLNNGEFNITLSGSELNVVGEYTWVASCCDLTSCARGYDFFYVTYTGSTQSTSQGIGSFGYLLLMVVLMFVFGYIGFMLFKNENWWILGIFFEFFALMFLVYNTWLGVQFHKYVTGLPTSNMPQIFFYIFLFILVVGTLTCLALLFRHWRKVFKYMKKEIKRKEPSDEDVEDWDMDRMAQGTWRYK